MKKRMIFYFFYFVVFLSFIFSSFYLLDFEVENHKSNQLYHQVVNDVSFQYQEEEYPYLDVSLDEAVRMNSDTVGWIEIPETNISYPVVQTRDNSYYLSHSFDHSENSAGWVFMDYRNQSVFDEQVILYGHNRLDGSMFGSLKNLLSSEEKTYLFYNTSHQKLTYEVFSMYILPEDEFVSTSNFNSSIEHVSFLESIQEKSMIYTGGILYSNYIIITLYTCYGYGKERLILHAKLVQVKDNS